MPHPQRRSGPWRAGGGWGGRKEEEKGGLERNESEKGQNMALENISQRAGGDLARQLPNPLSNIHTHSPSLGEARPAASLAENQSSPCPPGKALQ